MTIETFQQLDLSKPVPFEFQAAFDREKPAILVGCGAVAIDHHFPRIQSLVRRPTIFLLEEDEGRSAYLEDRWRSNPRVIVVKDVPEDQHFGLALIATPPKFRLHYFQALNRVSEFVILEKPIAGTLADAETIARESAIQGCSVFVNLIRRLLVNYRIIADAIHLNTFGGLLSVDYHEGGVFNWPAVSLGSFSKQAGGGGVLMDTGPHALDLLVSVLGEMAVESCKMDSWGDRSVEANCELRLRTAGGAPVVVSLSRSRNLSNECRFRFERATCILSVRDNRLNVQPSVGSPYSVLPSRGNPLNPIPYPVFFDMFYEQFIVPGANSSVNPEESVKSMALIERAYEVATPTAMSF